MVKECELTPEPKSTQHTISWENHLFDFFADQTDGVPVIGTYLWPNLIFGDRFEIKDTVEFSEVLGTLPVLGNDVLVTRGGGMFIQLPEELNTWNNDPHRFIFKEKLDFQEIILASLNALVCDLAIKGVVASPVSHSHIGRGRLIANHAALLGAEARPERTIGTEMAMHQGMFFAWHNCRPSLLDEIKSVAAHRQLIQVSDQLPLFVATAYTAYAEHQYSEALLHGFIVVEQYLSYLWDKHKKSIGDGKRRQRLEDYRTYSAAVQTEVLLTAGLISKELADQIHSARAPRNNLVHDAKFSSSGASAAMKAMECVLARIIHELKQGARLGYGQR